MEGFVLDYIFKFLPPNDLLTCMLVSREFCVYARTNAVWERHKRRVLEEVPALHNFIFTEEKAIWNIFTTYLMGDLIQKAMHDAEGLHSFVLTKCLYYVCSNDTSIKVRVEPDMDHLAMRVRINYSTGVVKYAVPIYIRNDEDAGTYAGRHIPGLLRSFKHLVHDNETKKKRDEFNKTVLAKINRD
jgi:hypothetical protein